MNKIRRTRERHRETGRERERDARAEKGDECVCGRVVGAGWRKWVMEFRERESRTKWLARLVLSERENERGWNGCVQSEGL